MGAKARLIFVLLLLSIASGVSPTFGADRDGSEAPLTDEDLKFRLEFGLPATAPAKASVEGLEKYGVRLSDAETRDIDKRFLDQERLDGLLEWASANAEIVGGVWLDQRVLRGHGFEVVIQLTEGGASFERAALGRVPEGLTARVEFVKQSDAALEATMERLVSARTTLAERGVQLLSVYKDPVSNAVVAEIGAGSPEEVIAVAPEAVVRSGVGLEPVSCNPSDRCTYLPYRGGLQLLDSDLSYQCTSGFWAKSGSIPYMITASHCWRYSLNTNVYRYSSSTHLGTWINDSIPGPGMACGPAICYANVEAAYFSPDGPLIPSVKNLIYKSGTDKSFQITGYKAYSNVAVGNAVCKAGVVTNYTCGTVTAKGHGFLPGGTGPRYGNLDLDLAKLIFTSATGNDGDSGGPVFGGPTAYGFSTAKDGSSHVVASSISYSLTELGLTLCVTSSC